MRALRRCEEEDLLRGVQVLLSQRMPRAEISNCSQPLVPSKAAVIAGLRNWLSRVNNELLRVSKGGRRARTGGGGEAPRGCPARGAAGRERHTRCSPRPAQEDPCLPPSIKPLYSRLPSQQQNSPFPIALDISLGASNLFSLSQSYCGRRSSFERNHELGHISFP